MFTLLAGKVTSVCWHLSLLSGVPTALRVSLFPKPWPQIRFGDVTGTKDRIMWPGTNWRNSPPKTRFWFLGLVCGCWFCLFVSFAYLPQQTSQRGTISVIYRKVASFTNNELSLISLQYPYPVTPEHASQHKVVSGAEVEFPSNLSPSAVSILQGVCRFVLIVCFKLLSNKIAHCSSLVFLLSIFFSFQQLLQKDPELRLSSVESLKAHAYFSEISFEDVLQKKVSPWLVPVPPLSGKIISRQPLKLWF